MEELYHICSDGKLIADLHMDNNDYIATVNRIAVIAFIFNVEILAFCLENTHIHLLVGGPYNQCVGFMAELQRCTMRYLQGRGNQKFELEILPVDTEDYLLIAGTYVICQATKDGRHILPYDHKWSSAALYFRTVKNDLLWRLNPDGSPKTIRKVKDLGSKERIRIFRTKHELPGEWEVCDGMVLPSSFVSVERFEDIYKTHNAFRVFCGTSKKKDQEVLDRTMAFRGISMEENEARIISMKEKFELYGSTTSTLSTEQRIRLARVLREKYRMGLSQIARRVHLPEAEIRRYVK